MKYIQTSLLLFISVLIFISCAKEENRDSDIPYAQVEIDINYKTEHQFDNAYYYKQYYTGKNTSAAGYVGVLAISLYSNNTNGTLILKAFELCCPYEAPLKNELNVVVDNWTLKCPKCNSQYSLIDDGRAKSGPAVADGKRLKSYAVYKGDVFYRIRN